MKSSERTLILACGALAREILDIININNLEHIELKCLPASLHNHPERIPDAVRDLIRKYRDNYNRILIGYGDCGTGGLLDKMLEQEGTERISGPHCYAFYSGTGKFLQDSETEFTAFYLTDFLVRQFEAMVIRPLGLDQHPELLRDYFSNYSKIVYLSQTENETLNSMAAEAANRLNLPLEIRHTGYGDLSDFLISS